MQHPVASFREKARDGCYATPCSVLQREGSRRMLGSPGISPTIEPFTLYNREVCQGSKMMIQNDNLVITVTGLSSFEFEFRVRFVRDGRTDPFDSDLFHCLIAAQIGGRYPGHFSA